MHTHRFPATARSRAILPVWLLGLTWLWLLWPAPAQAIPVFARQTGMACAGCHAGGQFPELTPFGRQFKLTGYTLGTRTELPISAMAVASMAKVANTGNNAGGLDFAKNGNVIFATASLLGGGRITNNLGLFAQVTYDPYATQDDQGSFHGHTNADNISLRYADHAVTPGNDLVWGLTLNNNPSISDPWNTAPAWMQYVPVPSPGNNQFIDGNAPYPGLSAGGNLAGLTVYGLWNQHLFAEVGLYGSANGLLRIMSAGVPKADNTQLRGLNPYWRLAYTQDWGDHHLMLGTTGMRSQVYDDPLDTSDPATVHHYRDLGLDAQYQYLADPHTVTAQLVYMTNRGTLPTQTGEDSTHTLRGKLSYVYQNTYGTSLSAFRLNGTVGGADPGTRGYTLELFWTPIESLRLGLQHTAYSRFDGASSNYDGLGRNARDNNSNFLYAWLAY